MTLLSDQEIVLKELGYQRYKNRLEKLEKNKLKSITDFGTEVLRKRIVLVAKELENLSASSTPKPLDVLDFNTKAFIALSIILNHISPDLSFVSLSLKIGNLIESEHNASLVKFPRGLSGTKLEIFLRAHKNYLKFSKREKIRLGTLAILAVENSTDLIECSIVRKNNKSYRVVNVTSSFTTLQDSLFKNNCYLEPVKKPLTVFPIPLDENLVGGYAFDVLSGKSVLKQTAKRHLRNLKIFGDSKKLANNLNKVQSVPYEVDNKILDVAWELYTNDKEVAGLPPHLEEVDVALLGSKDSSIRKKYFKLKEISQSIQGKRLNIARTLMLAKEFSGEDHFYFPVFIDFRARIYYNGDYLNPGGTDLSKALLTFKSKELISEEDAFWYYVHAANVYGIKGSYQEKFNWTQSHKQKIISIAKEPIKNLSHWEGADEPFSFLAFCFDAEQYWKTPDTHKSGLRLSFDATSSGLQILSLLLRDLEGCRRTNVLSNGTLKPSDVYQECFCVLRGLLEQDAQSGLEPVSELSSFWLEFFKGKNTRDLVKRPLMTTVYSLTRYGLQRYVEAWVAMHDTTVALEHLRYLGARVDEAIKNTVKGASLGMDWIRDVAKILGNAGHDLELLMPNGFYLISSYREPQSIKVSTKILGTTYTTRYRRYREKGKILKSRAANAAVPNLIHALDASILFEFMEGYPNACPISLVHDAVYFRASEANLVYDLIRESIVNVFEPNLLENFKLQLEERFNLELPALPELGDISFSDVRVSDYLYC